MTPRALLPAFLRSSALVRYKETDDAARGRADRLRQNKPFIEAVKQLRESRQINCPNNRQLLKRLISSTGSLSYYRAERRYGRQLQKLGVTPDNQGTNPLSVKQEFRARRVSGLDKAQAQANQSWNRLLGQLGPQDVPMLLLDRFKLPRSWELPISQFVLLDKLVGLQSAGCHIFLDGPVGQSRERLLIEVYATTIVQDVVKRWHEVEQYQARFLQGFQWKGVRGVHHPQLQREIAKLDKSGKSAREIAQILSVKKGWGGVKQENVSKMRQRMRRRVQEPLDTRNNL